MYKADICKNEGKCKEIVMIMEKKTWSQLITFHSSLLRTFGFSAISTYNSYLPSIFGTNALI